MSEDLVNHPPHYTNGKLETIDRIEDTLSPVEFQGYCKGNVLKYLSRAEYKGNPITDYEKAQWYLNRMIKSLREA